MQKRTKIAISIILLVTLLVAIVLELPSAQSYKALAFMSKVAGLDLTRYTVRGPISYSGNGFPDMLVYVLTSEVSDLKVFFQFENGTLQTCQLQSTKGSPIFAGATSTDLITSAKNILERYQSFSANIYIPTMQEMLNFTIARNEGGTFTRSLGEITLVIHVQNNIGDFVWSYTPNGMEDHYKTVDLTIENGNFKFFLNSWDLFKLGTTEVNVTREQAIKTAKDYALKTYSDYNSTFEILDNNAMATLSLQTRAPYMLYPHWEILLPLDKPIGAIGSIRVLLWADTGQVTYIAGV